MDPVTAPDHNSAVARIEGNGIQEFNSPDFIRATLLTQCAAVVLNGESSVHSVTCRCEEEQLASQ